jgi:acetyltransferase-like isoleucine patch superfamily enzyme
MNCRAFFLFLRYPKISGIFVPFRKFIPARIRVRSKQVKLQGRVFVGSPEKGKTVVSANRANIDFSKESQVSFGHSVSIGPGVQLVVKDQGKLSIGSGTYFTSDMHLECCHHIQIGEQCAISWGTSIIDSDHHELSYEGKKENASSVIIGDRVWIACNVVILKGTTIGSGSVVAAGSVVKGEFPSNVLIGGNPARILKENVNWK